MLSGSQSECPGRSVGAYMRQIRMVGLDFGTTTSRGIVATATLSQNPLSGRQELSAIREVFRSEPEFTPFSPEGLDESRLREYLEQWLAAGDVAGEAIFGGGALITGLAAQARNAESLVDLIRSRLGNALIAVADDPCFESWVAFHASAAEISRAHPERLVVNLDIGGGTTNIAVGKNGEVLRTGSLFVGARHVEVVPGTYRLTKLSPFTQALFEHLRINRQPGDCLDETEIAAITDFYLFLIENALAGREDAFQGRVARLHQQVPFVPPADLDDAIVTVSGGVGELVYSHLANHPLPSTTTFGDLGIDLARRLLASPDFAPRIAAFVPACGGRATVYGLLRHATQISGSTLFLPDPEVLPLRDIPIFGRITSDSTDEQIHDQLRLVGRGPRGGCLRIALRDVSAAALAAVGSRLAQCLKITRFDATRPLILLVEENIGKALGNYVTEWGRNPYQIIVVDEIEFRDARFIQVGAMRNQVVPVAFYGMN